MLGIRGEAEQSKSPASVTHPVSVEPIELSVSDLRTPEQPKLDDWVCCLFNNVFIDLHVNDILAQIPCEKTE